MITLEQIKKEIAEAIQLSGLTYSEIARRLYVNQQTISRYIKGDTLPSLDTLANLCVILDLDANEILCVR